MVEQCWNGVGPNFMIVPPLAQILFGVFTLYAYCIKQNPSIGHLNILHAVIRKCAGGWYTMFCIKSPLLTPLLPTSNFYER